MTARLLKFWEQSPDDPFDALFDHAPVMTHSMGEDGTLLRVSHFLASALGYEPSDMVGRELIEFMTRESSDRTSREILPALNATGHIEDVSCDFLRRDGTTLPVRMSAIVQTGPDGGDRRSLTVMFDDTEARRSANILDAALSAIPEGLVIYDPEDRLVRCNDAYREIYAASAPAIREGASFESILQYGLDRGQYPEAGDTAESKAAWLANRLASHRRPNGAIEQRIGPERWLSINERLTPGGHMVGIRYDISALKKAQSEAERFGRILEGSRHEIYALDATTLKFEIVNAAARDNLQYTIDELREMTPADISADFDDEARLFALIDDLSTGARSSIKVRTHHRRKDGTLYPCHIGVELDRSGGRPLLVAFCEDVSEREALQNEIADRNIELAEKNRELIEIAAEAARASSAKSVFLANMSHEIRTPLNGVLGMASALALTELSPEQSEMADVVLWSGNQLLALLNDVLDLSKIEAGEISMEREEADAQTLLSDVAILFDARAAEKDLFLDVETSRSARIPFLANTNRVRQVITNLVSNAIKFTDSGGIKLGARLEETADPNHRKLTLTVTDTGKGVPDDMKSVIFGRFEQGEHTVERELGGTGLGLSIASTICELHGGILTVEDAPGGGARFLAVFEVGHVDAPEGFQKKPAPAPRLKKTLSRPLKLLIAEDNPANQRVMKILLGFVEGATPTFVSNGEEALEMIEAEHFDAGLIDIRMPDMDGLEMMKIHRENERRTGSVPVPMVACSANTMRDQISHYHANGFGRCLPKPFDQEKLHECLEWIIGELDQNTHPAD